MKIWNKLTSPQVTIKIGKGVLIVLVILGIWAALDGDGYRVLRTVFVASFILLGMKSAKKRLAKQDGKNNAL